MVTRGNHLADIDKPDGKDRDTAGISSIIYGSTPTTPPSAAPTFAPTLHPTIYAQPSENFGWIEIYEYPKDLKIHDNANSYYSIHITSGDINGDGRQDLIISYIVHYRDTAIRELEDFIYVIYGKNELEIQDINVRNILPSQGFRISDDSEKLFQARAIADVNGDGYDDIVILRATHDRSGLGNNYYDFHLCIVFGKKSGLNNIYLGSFSESVTIYPEQSFSISSSRIGDVNGDGIDDIGIISNKEDEAQKIYILLGKRDWSNDIYLSSFSSSDGIRFYGTTPDEYVHSITGIGDFNGDGIDDIAISLEGLHPTIYVVYGSSSGIIDIHKDYISVNNGFRIYSSLDSRISGVGLWPKGCSTVGFPDSHFGDINGDGYSDIIVSSGNSWTKIIFGAPTNDDIDFDTYTNFLGNNRGACIDLNDINNDGFFDLIYSKEESTYIIFGKANFKEIYDSIDLKYPPVGSVILERVSSAYDVSSIFDWIGNNNVEFINRGLGCYGCRRESVDKLSLALIMTGSVVPQPTHSPTPMPASSFYIDSGATYNGTAAGENFVIDISEDIIIYGGGGGDIYTLAPYPGVTVTIGDFDKSNDILNLNAFSNIQQFNDLNITSGSILINLEENQKIKLLNLNPGDIDTNNFIFTTMFRDDDRDDDSDENSGNNFPLSQEVLIGIVAGTALIIAGGCAAYAYVNNYCPFTVFTAVSTKEVDEDAIVKIDAAKIAPEVELAGAVVEQEAAIIAL